jgi:hypothetical protein
MAGLGWVQTLSSPCPPRGCFAMRLENPTCNSHDFPTHLRHLTVVFPCSYGLVKRSLARPDLRVRVCIVASFRKKFSLLDELCTCTFHSKTHWVIFRWIWTLYRVIVQIGLFTSQRGPRFLTPMFPHLSILSKRAVPQL